MISPLSVINSPLKSEVEEGKRFLMSVNSEKETDVLSSQNDAVVSSFQPIPSLSTCNTFTRHLEEAPTSSGSLPADAKTSRSSTRQKKPIVIPEFDSVQSTTEGNYTYCVQIFSLFVIASKLRPPRSGNKVKVSSKDDEVPTPRGASSPRRSASPNFESTLRRTKTPDILEEFWIQDLRGRMKSNEALQASCNKALDIPTSSSKPTRSGEKRTRSESPAASAVPPTPAPACSTPTPNRLSPTAFAVPGEIDVGDVYLLRNMTDMAACHKSAQFGFSWWGIRESGFLRVELEKGKHLKPYLSSASAAPSLGRSQSMPSVVPEPLITVIDANALKRKNSADSQQQILDEVAMEMRQERRGEENSTQLFSTDIEKLTHTAGNHHNTHAHAAPLPSPRPRHFSDAIQHHTQQSTSTTLSYTHGDNEVPWYKKHRRWEMELQNHRNLHYNSDYPPPPLPSPHRQDTDGDLRRRGSSRDGDMFGRDIPPPSSVDGYAEAFEAPRDRSGSFSGRRPRSNSNSDNRSAFERQHADRHHRHSSRERAYSREKRRSRSRDKKRRWKR